MLPRVSVRHFVVAGFAAGLAIVEAILAEANLQLRLAGAAVLFALAAVFRAIALHAKVFGFSGGSGHIRNVSRPAECAKFRWYVSCTDCLQPGERQVILKR